MHVPTSTFTVRSIGFLFTLFLAVFADAQNSERRYQKHEIFDSYLEISVSDGKIALTPLSDKIMEVQFLTDLQPANPPSSAVIKTPESVVTQLDENENTLTYKTPGLSVEIVKQPFQLKFSFRDKELVSEQLGYFASPQQRGFKFNLTENEVLYGAGSRALPMNRRGYALPLYNTPSYGYTNVQKEMYYSIPLVISSRKYMILWDNSARGEIDFGAGQEDVLSLHAIGGRKAYYLIAGEDFYDLNTQYTALTGRQPLPPRWALGNIASRFGYRNQEETETTIALYREKQVPVDAVVIDLYWFGKDIKGHMGNLEWDYDAWPKPQKMMRDFRRQGVHTILITEPFILKSSKRWQEALEQDVLAKNYRGEPYVFDFYFGTSGLIDIFKPEARTWFWDIYRRHTREGVSAWWGDLGEPEHHPADMVHANGTAEYVHNIYGHEWAKLVYEGYRQDFPKRRPFVLMRAGFAGSQRYGLASWSGDVSRSWEGLAPQPVMAMQMGMQGIGYAHSDLGGFAPHEVDGKPFVDPMLYTRWLQYGVFQPIYRPHSADSLPSEPVYWDARTLELTRQAINLRYRLFPYNYTLAYENSSKGYPMMRPLFYAEPDNASLYEYGDAYLWGDNILVAPVLKARQTHQQVRFPGNSTWVDYYTGERYAGGTEASITLHDEYIPTFIRSGAFVPMIPPGLQTSKNYSTQKLDLLYFADPDTSSSHYTLYDDDGESAGAIKNAQFELLTFSAENSSSQLVFTVESNGGRFKGRPGKRELTFIVAQLDAMPKGIIVDGKHFAPGDGAWDRVVTPRDDGKWAIRLDYRRDKGEVVVQK